MRFSTLITCFFLIKINVNVFAQTIQAVRIEEDDLPSVPEVPCLSGNDDACQIDEENPYPTNETCDESICNPVSLKPHNITSFRKCCKHDEYFDNDFICRVDPAKRFADFEREQLSNFRFLYGQPCPNFIISTERFNFPKSGYLTVETHDGVFTASNSCLEFTKINDLVSLRPALCFDGEIEDGVVEDESRYEWFFWGMLASVIALTLTFINYSFLRTLRRKFRTKCLLCHVFALILGYCGLIVVQSCPTDEFICLISAYATQYGFLSCFFWLNVMCIDLWLMSQIAAPRHTSGKTFAMYCLYAWGCPFLISMFTALVDLSIIPYKFQKPNFGAPMVCFFKKEENLDFWEDPKFWFFYLYMSVLLVLNTCMFARVAWFLFVKNHEWSSSERKGSKRHRKRSKNTFVLYLKLFLLMGVSWIVEIITFFYKDVPEHVTVLDVFNTFQGMVIFVLFCLSDSVIREWKKILFPTRIPSSKNTSISRVYVSKSAIRFVSFGKPQSCDRKTSDNSHDFTSVSSTKV